MKFFTVFPNLKILMSSVCEISVKQLWEALPYKLSTSCKNVNKYTAIMCSMCVCLCVCITFID